MEEWEEHATMVASAGRGAVIESTREESAVSVEPALGFEEGEEEQARRAEECELGAVVERDAAGEGVAEVGRQPLERSVEAAGYGFAAEDVEPACVGERVGLAVCGGEGAGRFGVAVDDAFALDEEGGEVWRGGGVGPGGKGELAEVVVGDGEEPEDVWRRGCESRRDASDGVADREVIVGGDDECAERAGP